MKSLSGIKWCTRKKVNSKGFLFGLKNNWFYKLKLFIYLFSQDVQSSRFPAEKLKILEDWFQKNLKNGAYANRQNKELLAEQTSLSEKQITNWLCHRRFDFKHYAKITVSHKQNISSTFLPVRFETMILF